MREVVAGSRNQYEGVVPSLVQKWFFPSPRFDCQERVEQVDPGVCVADAEICMYRCCKS